MPTPLEALTAGLFEVCDERLGDSIIVTPPSPAAPIPCLAHVNFAEQRTDFGVSAIVAQDISVDIDKSLLPGEPGDAWRVTFAVLPGRTFSPRAPQLDESGRRWIFGVKEIVGG